MPALTLENSKEHAHPDPLSAALAEVVSRSATGLYCPSSSSTVRPKEKERTRGKLDQYFRHKEIEKTLESREEEWEPPHRVHEEETSEETAALFEDWDSRERTPSIKRMRTMTPAPPEESEEVPRISLDKTVKVLAKVLGAGDDDPDLTALWAALKATLGLSNLKKPPVTLSPGVETLARNVKICRGIRSKPRDSCPSPFHPRVRTIPACSVAETSIEDLEVYGVVALAPLAIANPTPPDSTGGSTGKSSRAIATSNLQVELPEFHPKNLPEWADEVSEFLPLTGQQNVDVKINCTLIK